MNNSHLPVNAYYTKEGAIVFKKTQRTKDIEKVEEKVNELEEQIAELRKLLEKKDK